MAYQALYRKWRPTTFDDVVGQDAVAGTLKNQIRTGRIGHAYLFCGTRGCGKTSLAKIMARAVNCPEALEHDGNPCNECPSCTSIMSGSSMNVFEIDAASNNGVDNIRDIREQVEYPPTEGKYKVYIIDEVHMLSAGAFNALLKTLEEPPAYVIFILATTDPQKVPQTILSRCQRYDFRRMGKASIIGYINKIRDAEGFGAEDKAIDYIADAADGSMRDGLSILDQCLAYAQGEMLTYEKVLEVLGAADMSVFSDLYRAIVKKDPRTVLSLVDDAIASGKEAGLFINDFIWYLRNVLLASATRGGDSVLEVTEDSLARIQEDTKLLPEAELIRILSSMAELQNRARFAPRKRVLLEVELIRLSAVSAQVPVYAAPPQQASPVPTAAGSQAAPVYTAAAAVPAADIQQANLSAQTSPAASASSAPASVAASQAAQAPRQTDSSQGSAPRTLRQAQTPDPAVTQEALSHIGEKLVTVQENWDSLLAGLSPANRVLFKDVALKEERGGILIIFRNKINFSLASRNEENGLLRLKALCLSDLGVNVNFLARTELPGEFPREAAVITDEELAKINFPVNIQG